MWAGSIHCSKLLLTLVSGRAIKVVAVVAVGTSRMTRAICSANRIWNAVKLRVEVSRAVERMMVGMVLTLQQSDDCFYQSERFRT
jgi:hypothetical protein